MHGSPVPSGLPACLAEGQSLLSVKGSAGHWGCKWGVWGPQDGRGSVGIPGGWGFPEPIWPGRLCPVPYRGSWGGAEVGAPRPCPMDLAEGLSQGSRWRS